jgi:flagellar motor protein MotB
MVSSGRSTLHLQMGQETLYLLLTSAFFGLVVLIAYIAAGQHSRQVAARHTDEQPMVTLPEREGFTFSPGSYTINTDFMALLVRRRIVQTLEDRARQSQSYIVEVVGNTDEVPVQTPKRLASNLDTTLVAFINGKKDAPDPVAGDNVGLGMARAVAVARALRQLGLPAQFEVIPLSAGPVVMPNDTLADGSDRASDLSRRRIEIRLRQHPPLG